MKRVVIESPLSAPTRKEIDINKGYARQCVKDSLRRGEAPYASHLFFDHPEILDDLKPEERELGIKAGFAWGEAAEAVIFYVDNGISRGMTQGFERAMRTDADIIVRSLKTKEELLVPINITLPTYEDRDRNLDNLLEAVRAVTAASSSSSSSPSGGSGAKPRE